jgi:hypothetical protein
MLGRPWRQSRRHSFRPSTKRRTSKWADHGDARCFGVSRALRAQRPRRDRQVAFAPTQKSGSGGERDGSGTTKVERAIDGIGRRARRCVAAGDSMPMTRPPGGRGGRRERGQSSRSSVTGLAEALRWRWRGSRPGNSRLDPLRRGSARVGSMERANTIRNAQSEGRGRRARRPASCALRRARAAHQVALERVFAYGARRAAA